MQKRGISNTFYSELRQIYEPRAAGDSLPLVFDCFVGLLRLFSRRTCAENSSVARAEL